MNNDNSLPAGVASREPAAPSAGMEECLDCMVARAHSASEATTPGFFYPYCMKHAPVPTNAIAAAQAASPEAKKP